MLEPFQLPFVQRGLIEILILAVPAGLTARLDRRRFNVVLANLVGNALRHGGPPVTVKAGIQPDGRGGKQLAMEVRDHGDGLPPAAIPYVFDRFYKADTARALLGPAHPELDDLVQDVLVAVFDALPSFRGESTLLHFAIRIAARRATTMRRRSRSVLEWLESFFRREQFLVREPANPRDEVVADRRRRYTASLGLGWA